MTPASFTTLITNSGTRIGRARYEPLVSGRTRALPAAGPRLIRGRRSWLRTPGRVPPRNERIREPATGLPRAGRDDPRDRGEQHGRVGAGRRAAVPARAHAGVRAPER